MDNLINRIKEGMAGKNKGIPGGLPKFDKVVYNIQPGKMVSIVGSSKSGKTAFMLWRYIFIPWINGERNIKYFLYSLEVDLDQIKGRLISMFIYYLKNIEINPNKIYSMGDEKLSPEEFKIVSELIESELNPLFEKITFICDKSDSNPTGIYKSLLTYANNNGTTKTESYKTKDDLDRDVIKERVTGYTPNNPDEKVFVIIDTLGLMKRERGFSKKENMDKWLEDYAITLRNIYKYSVINLHHLNRSLSTVDRQKFQKEDLQPELDDIKDTSSIGESSDMVIAIFNPNVYKQIKVHQGYNILNYNGKYRSLHVLASRYTEFPINSALMFDFIKGNWTEL